MYAQDMASGRQSEKSAPAEIAQQLHEALLRERIVPRFVDSYVVENGRQALQVHAVMYRDLLALLQREALLELSVRALEIICNEPREQGRSKPRPMHRREAALFRKRFLAALARQKRSISSGIFSCTKTCWHGHRERGAAASRLKQRIIPTWTAARFYWTLHSWSKRAWQPAGR